MARPLHTIAAEIRQDWENPHYAAVPYLEALGSLRDLDDSYGADDARSVVLYFLTNAGRWRGPKAKEIKAEASPKVKARMRGRNSQAAKAAIEASANRRTIDVNVEDRKEHRHTR